MKEKSVATENVVHPMTVRLQVVQKENAVVQVDVKLILV
jgi:hypothetical protein